MKKIKNKKQKRIKIRTFKSKKLEGDISCNPLYTQPLCNTREMEKEYDFGWMLPFAIILLLAIGFFMLFYVGAILLITAMCFILPFYIAIKYNYLGIIIGIITFPIGLAFIEYLASLFNSDIKSDIDL